MSVVSNSGHGVGYSSTKGVWIALATLFSTVLAISLGFGIYVMVRS